MLLFGFFRIVGKSELDASANDSVRINIPISLGNNLSVDCSWTTTCRCPVILNSLLHNLNLLWREPLLKSGVSCKNLTASDVMISAMPAHTQIVICSYGINHICISTCRSDQLKRITYNSCDVLKIVGTVEFGILWEYLSLDKLH